ncbi:MAG: DUF4288 domain-containing protein [Planctomycetia bacterium]|nr:DUF4288 domain-containing protein [Planctomycetia bacterium]
MKWFAAHLVMAVHWKGEGQTRFPVWENIVLVAAKSENEAFAKAEAYGQSEAGDEGGSFRWDGKPATWVFTGVRKLTECVGAEDQPGDGTEITFNELEFASLKAVADFVASRPTDVRYRDRFPTPRSAKPVEQTKRGKRKPA